MVTQEENIQQPNRTPSCQGPYRPYRPVGLTIAIVAYFLVYWYFGFLVEDIDLTGPVAWYDTLSQLLSGILTLPALASPYVRFVLNLASPKLMLYSAGPYLVAWLLAMITTHAFLQQFYGIAQLKQAASLKKWLYHAKRLEGPLRFSNNGRILMLPLFYVLVLGMAMVIVALVGYTQTLQGGSDQFNFIMLISILTVLWLSLTILSLAISPDGLLWKFLLLCLLIIVPVAMTAASFILIYWRDVSAMLIIRILFFGGLAVALTGAILWLIKRLRWPPPPGPVKVTREELEEKRGERALLQVGGPGIIWIGESYQVAVTESNGRFCRILGPGMNVLDAFEYLHSVLDLRQHDSEETKTFVTRDGLNVKINARVTFRIASNDDVLNSPEPDNLEDDASDVATRPTGETLFPYSGQAVRMAAYTKTVFDQDGTVVKEWHDLPLIFAQVELKKLVAERRYDELFVPEEINRMPHPALRSEVLARTRALVQRSRTGVHLLDVRLGAVEAVSADVAAEHIKTWSTAWKTRSQMLAAEAEALAYQEKAEAQREATRLFVQTITESVSRAKQEAGGEATQQVMAMLVVDSLSRIARRSQYYDTQLATALIQQIHDFQEELGTE